MKNTIVKSLCAFLALALILSTATMVAFAAETAHNHTFVQTNGGEGYEYYSNTQHSFGYYKNYDCACGMDSYRIFIPLYQAAHVAMPGSQQLVASCLGDDGRMVSTYQYICKTCYSAYTVNVKE